MRCALQQSHVVTCSVPYFPSTSSSPSFFFSPSSSHFPISLSPLPPPQRMPQSLCSCSPLVWVGWGSTSLELIGSSSMILTGTQALTYRYSSSPSSNSSSSSSSSNSSPFFDLSSFSSSSLPGQGESLENWTDSTCDCLPTAHLRHY